MGMFELFKSYSGIGALEVMSKRIGESPACGRTIES